MKLLKNTGSFRDPAGQIYYYDNRIIRIIKNLEKKVRIFKRKQLSKRDS